MINLDKPEHEVFCDKLQTHILAEDHEQYVLDGCFYSKLDLMARSLEQLGCGGSFRRISKTQELYEWCLDALNVLRKKLKRTNKKWIGQ